MEVGTYVLFSTALGFGQKAEQVGVRKKTVAICFYWLASYGG